MTSFLTMRLVDKAKNRGWKPSPLVPLKQIPRVHLVRHIYKLVAPAVGDDHVAAGLEGPRSWVTSEPKNSGAFSVGS